MLGVVELLLRVNNVIILFFRFIETNNLKNDIEIDYIQVHGSLCRILKLSINCSFVRGKVNVSKKRMCALLQIILVRLSVQRQEVH